MVAITVILAAVIAAFVLGFGAGTEAPPTASIDMEQDGDDLVIEHLSGSNIDGENLVLRGDAIGDEEEFGYDLSSGDIVYVNGSEWDSGTVNLVWDSGDEASTLASVEWDADE